MRWTQVIDPFDNIALSALVALIPIIFVFWALIIRKMKGHQTSLIAILIAVIIAVVVYGMPFRLAALSAVHGALYGLFPICWIVITAVFLFNVTVKSGQFEIIKHVMASITADRRLQGLLIAFSFGSFLEGTAGFGAPVAITAAMLVGLGFNPLYAAGICLIANTAPRCFWVSRYSHHSGVAGIRDPGNGHFADGRQNTSRAVCSIALLPRRADVRFQESHRDLSSDIGLRHFLCSAAMVLIQLSGAGAARRDRRHRIAHQPHRLFKILEACAYLALRWRGGIGSVR